MIQFASRNAVFRRRNLYLPGKGVSTKVLNYISRGGRIAKKLGGKFLHGALAGLSITNDNEFCFL